MFFWWTTAALIWISIHPYALTLQAAVDNFFDVRQIMKAESDFYNVISAVQARGFCVDTMMAIQIIWTQLKYNRVFNDDF